MFQLLFFPPKNAITKKQIFVPSCFPFFSKKMPPDAPALVDNPTVNRRKRKDLTPSQRQFVIDQSLRNLKHGEDGKDEINGKLVLLPGVTKKLAIKLDVNETTVRRVWKRACSSCLPC